ncbi:MAG: thrombospondin type 3 repeat-containing protein [Verrucomicrobiota bacterium]|jgi:hypothetical protein
MRCSWPQLGGSILLSLTLSVQAAVLYVDVNSAAPAPPYTNWSTAATNIQDAVDAADPGDLVLVTNGLYQTGGAVIDESNRVAVTKPLTIQSVNGPAATTIMGSRGNIRLDIPYVRCVFLTNGAALAGFTLTNGSVFSESAEGGGGVCGAYSYPFPPTALVSNCVLTGNSATTEGGGAYGVALNNCILTGNTASTGGGASTCILNNCMMSGNTANGEGPISPADGYGGGAYLCNMNNCLITGNSASVAGGGVCIGTLNNCTIVSNTAPAGGGVCPVSMPAPQAVALTNCIVFDNSATNGPNYRAGPVFSYCCTTPLPSGGIGNFTNAPLFVNEAGGDFHLQTNSPCINAGNNAYAPGPTDLDGNPRIVGGTVDMGAYEFQFPTSVISYQWLQYYGLPTDGSADYADTDGDGMNNWQEWIAGTNPTNAASALRMLSATGTGSGVMVSWTSVTNRSYSLERATNLGASPAFFLLGSNIAGLAGATTFTDTNAVGAAPRFYRVLVEQ